MKLARAAVTLALAAAGASAALAACGRDDRAGTPTTTSVTSVEIADPKATDQSNSKDDLALVQSVRQRLVGDGMLSFRAKNAVVVVQDGVVTLRGEVADRVDHDLVIAKVASIPQVVRIDDRLTFKE
jgi:osmotically-inducible protein OsmY